MAGSEWGVIGQKAASQVIVQLYFGTTGGSGNSVLATFKVSYIEVVMVVVLCPQKQFFKN